MHHRAGLRKHCHLWGLSLALLGWVTAPGVHAQTPASEPEAASDMAKPVFLVTDIVVTADIPGLDADAARDILSRRFGRFRDKIDVRSLSEVKATVDRVALAAMLGADRDADLAGIGNYVDVDRLVFGRIANVGGVLDLSVRVFNVRDAVTEIAIARRLPAEKAGSLVLTQLDAMGDQLAAWTLQTYTDNKASAAFDKLKGKKLGPKPPPPTAMSPWTLSGVSGGVVAGVGFGVLGVGATLLATDATGEKVTPIVVLGVGAAAMATGLTLVVLDGFE